MNLKSDKVLEASDIVANRTMNRERALSGDNSYEREFGVDPVPLLKARAQDRGTASWLDLCCGSGRALLDAAESLAGLRGVALHGVDLVSFFDRRRVHRPDVTLTVASLHSWEPSRRYSLITCFYGLHYIGDKLGLIARAASWLEEDGRLVCNLDLAHVQDENGQSIRSGVEDWLVSAGFEVDEQLGVVRTSGSRAIQVPYEYLGANDGVGPNSSGQPGVASIYRPTAAKTEDTPVR